MVPVDTAVHTIILEEVASKMKGVIAFKPNKNQNFFSLVTCALSSIISFSSGYCFTKFLAILPSRIENKAFLILKNNGKGNFKCTNSVGGE